ncbi:peroxisomal biogenesis factor 19 [Xylocopa sonorina]|uniref:peroxisomal biogenesis factor 19 n=1 Tax=Xylocopa sonorina TaxID=1818115 RepID=UPI00403A9252
MADERKSHEGKSDEDQELNDLLESALKDFSKEQKSDKVGTCKVDASESATNKNTSNDLEDDWTADFIKQATEHFEENLPNFIQNEADKNEFGASFQKLMQSVTSVMKDEDNLDKNSTTTDFQSAIAQALNDLSATSENLQSEDDLSELLGQASLECGSSLTEGAVLPFLQGMLQYLLSKEILYPSLKELVDKYPEWLAEQRATISPSDLQRFTKQLELMQQVCMELDKEEERDTEEIKKRRFERIISLMQELQGHGQLPEELIGEQTMPFQMVAEGNPVIPVLLRGMESPQNCCLM